MKELEYEIRDNNSNKVVGTIWWDGRTISSDNRLLLESLRKVAIFDKTVRDGKAFLDLLPYHYSAGYLGAFRVNKQ